MTQDTLSEVLRAVRLKGAVFFSVSCGGPWVAEAPSGEELAPYVMPGSEHVIEYHLVTEGSCYGSLIGEPAIALQRGDVIVFPQGDAHVMSSAPGMRGDRALAFESARAPSLPISLSMGSADNTNTHVVCGFLGCDARPFNPLLETLPRVIHLRARDGSPALEQLVQLALAESEGGTPGGQCMLSRVSELLFVEVVRRYIALMPDGHTGWLAGLRDELVGRSLGRLHDRPAHPWTLDDLAREVGASRSVLAERFAHYVGMPPMGYLARWRMQIASGLLTSGSKNLASIAAEVGYGSEAAFSRAFKREVGIAPAEFRRSPRAALSA